MEERENRFWAELCNRDKKPFAVELDSPEGPDTSKFMAGAAELKEKGAALITVADCPVARPRMDSSLMACKIKRELGMDAMAHLTCRDRNRNASQALLLGLHAEGLRHVLLVTGDPIPQKQRQRVKSVFNFNSEEFIEYVRGLYEQALPSPFHIFAALNVNARNFSVELERARAKEAAGAEGFFTQPVLTAQALENLKLARETLDGKLAGGIIPMVSHRNAVFMNENISGITVDERIIRLFEGADRQKGEELAIRVSAAVAAEIAPYIDSYYLMTPFGRTGLMGRIMDRIREEGLA